MKYQTLGNGDISENQLYDFLYLVKNEFPIPLDDKTDLKETTKKLLSLGDVIVLVSEGEIVGLVAGYNNDLETKKSYISLLALLQEHRGSGLATSLVESFIKKATNSGMEKIFLFTHSTNTKAVNLYKKLGFYEVELRPNGDYMLEKILIPQ